MTELVCIKKFNNLNEAKVAKSFLESNGIEADIITGGLGGYPAGLQIIPGIRLMVKEEDKDKALKLLG